MDTVAATVVHGCLGEVAHADLWTCTASKAGLASPNTETHVLHGVFSSEWCCVISCPDKRALPGLSQPTLDNSWSKLSPVFFLSRAFLLLLAKHASRSSAVATLASLDIATQLRGMYHCVLPIPEAVIPIVPLVGAVPAGHVQNLVPTSKFYTYCRNVSICAKVSAPSNPPRRRGA